MVPPARQWLLQIELQGVTGRQARSRRLAEAPGCSDRCSENCRCSESWPQQRRVRRRRMTSTLEAPAIGRMT